MVHKVFINLGNMQEADGIANGAQLVRHPDNTFSDTFSGNIAKCHLFT